MNKSRLNIILVSLLLLLVEITFANVKLASVFSDHMVLQADKTIVVWGTADIAELVTVEINGNKAISRTDINGKWQLELPAMKYSGPFELMVSGDDTLVLKNVMIGEVWLCAGQSNMRMTVKGVINAKEEIANANYKKIRFLTVPLAGAETTQDSFDAKWQVCSQATVGELTAAGYFFGRKLHEELDVAIGLIDISYGGATIAAFMDESTVANTVDTATFNETQKKRWEGYITRVANWEKNGRKEKRPSFRPQHFSTLCYNAMVNPIVPVANRGAIWYQGESNTAEPEKYVTWFGDYISMMRKKFNNPEMPFYFVQLAGFENQHNTNVPPEIWAKFRLGQEQCLKHPNTGMATAIDIGVKDNIHPKNKQEVGRRLALNALNQTYGETDVVFKGPQLKSIEKKDKSLLLRFDHCEDGLKNNDKGKYVKGFSAVLTNGEIIDVEGKIKSNNTIEIKGSTIKRLRYAYANYPVCPLYNGAGLPALPFDKLVE
jgi:sialate O-acetylesterase